MNFKVIEFGVLSHSVRPLSLLTPVATKYRMIEIKQPTKHFFFLSAEVVTQYLCPFCQWELLSTNDGRKLWTSLYQLLP